MKNLITWIRKLCQPTSARRVRPLSINLSVENLEDRMVPATLVWDGGAAPAIPNWSAAQNWVGDVAPVAGDDLQFPASVGQLAAVNDYPSGTVFNSISVSGTGYTLSGSALTLMAGIKTSNTTLANTVSMPLTLGADQTFTSGVGQTNLVLSGSTLDNGGHTLTFAGTGDFQFSGGSITGAGGLTKSGAGILFLMDSVPNTYSGPTTVNAGTLQSWAPAGNALSGSQLVIAGGKVLLVAPNQINDATPVTINGTGSLNLNGNNDTVGALTLQGGQITTSAGILTLNGDVTSLPASVSATISGKLNLGNALVRTFTVGNGTAAADLDVSASISGAGVQLVKQGPGALELDGSDSYGGGNLVSQGTLWITGSNALGTAGAATTVSAGASLLLKGSTTFASYPLVLNGAGDPNLAGGGALQGDGTLVWPGQITLASASTIVQASGKLTLNGMVAGAGNLTKAGAGEVALNNANTYTGATSVTAGALTAAKAAALGATGPASGTTVSGTGALQLAGGLTFAPESLTLSGTGGGTLSALHALGNSTWTGPITLAAASQINAVHGATLQIASTISGPASSSLTVGRSGTKADNGTVLLTAANPYAGATTVSVGTLAINNATALGSPVGVANPGTTVSTGATLQLQGGFVGTTFDSTEALTLYGSGLGDVGALQNTSVFGTNTWTAPITLVGGVSIGDQGTGTLDIPAVIAGPNGALVKVGIGVLVLDAANTWTGGAIVVDGALALNNAAALGTTTSGVCVNAGSLQLMGGIVYNPKPLRLNGAGAQGTSITHGGALCNLTGNNTWTGNITLGTDSTVEAEYGTQLTLQALPGSPTQDVALDFHKLTVKAYGDVVMADNINGSGSLLKYGAGTLTFAGASPNTYTGTTTVSEGTLNLAKYAGIIAVGGALTIQAGAFLTGSGTIYASVTNSGTINPGGTGAVGTLTIQGNYTQTASGVLNLELGGTTSGAFDQLAISGQASLAGTLNVSLLPGYQPSHGDAFAALKFASSVGGFAVVNGLSLSDGDVLAMVSNPTDLTLVTNPA